MLYLASSQSPFYMKWECSSLNYKFNVAFDWKRFQEGLKTLGVLEKLQKHPEGFRPLFSYRESRPTAEAMEDLFSIRLSDQGSNRRRSEEIVISFWRDYLQDAEGKSSCFTKHEHLIFLFCNVFIHQSLKYTV